MPADGRRRVKAGRSLRQPLVSMAALTFLAVCLVLLLLRLGAWS
jgi:hypothetical protein